MSKLINVESKYITAIETALGGAVQDIVTDTAKNAKNAMLLLKNKNAGRATFLPLTTVQGRALQGGPAGGATVAGVAVHRMLAVHGLGHDSGTGSFAGSPGTDKKVGVAEPTGPDLILQRPGNMLLPRHIVKGLARLYAEKHIVHFAVGLVEIVHVVGCN